MSFYIYHTPRMSISHCRILYIGGKNEHQCRRAMNDIIIRSEGAVLYLLQQYMYHLFVSEFILFSRSFTLNRLCLYIGIVGSLSTVFFVVVN